MRRHPTDRPRAWFTHQSSQWILFGVVLPLLGFQWWFARSITDGFLGGPTPVLAVFLPFFFWCAIVLYVFSIVFRVFHERVAVRVLAGVNLVICIFGLLVAYHSVGGLLRVI